MRRFHEHRVVEECERLEGRVRPLAADNAHVGIGRVERSEHRVGAGALEPDVKPALVPLRTGGFDPLHAVGVGEFGDARRLRRLDRRPTDRRVQEAAGRKCVIAKQFGFDEKALLPRVEYVQRVALLHVRADSRGLLVGRRRDDELVEALEAPGLRITPDLAVGVRPLTRQPVQQFRVRRLLALRAKILRRGDQPAAEELRPHPVDCDPRCERIVLRDNPPRQIQPCGSKPNNCGRWEDARCAGLHLDASPQEIASTHHVRGPRGTERERWSLRPGGSFLQVGRQSRLALLQVRVGGLLRLRVVDRGLKLRRFGVERDLLLLQPLVLARQRGSDVHFAVGVEEREKLVELALRNRVVLVVVALRTAHRETEPHLARGANAIHHRRDAKLLLIDPAFLVRECVPVEACGDLLLHSRVREQITRELFDCELIERHICVEGVNHPVAIPPRERTAGVLLVAVAVRVASGIEPVPPPALAVVWRREQPIDHLLVSVGRFVFQKRIDLFRCGREAGEVERHAAEECGLVRFRRGRKPFLLEASANECVDRVRGLRPGDNRSLNWLKGPVIRLAVLVQNSDRAAPLRALVDPRAELTDLGVREPLVLARGHLLIRVAADEPRESDDSQRSCRSQSPDRYCRLPSRTRCCRAATRPSACSVRGN